MKYLMLIILATLIGCSKTTSESLLIDAKKSCEKEVETDGRQRYCELGYIVQKCEYGLLDLKICGTLGNR